MYVFFFVILNLKGGGVWFNFNVIFVFGVFIFWLWWYLYYFWLLIVLVDSCYVNYFYVWVFIVFVSILDDLFIIFVVDGGILV